MKYLLFPDQGYGRWLAIHERLWAIFVWATTSRFDILLKVTHSFLLTYLGSASRSLFLTITVTERWVAYLKCNQQMKVDLSGAVLFSSINTCGDN
jgi:hypothetical protein